MGVAATLPELSEWALTTKLFMHVHFCSSGMKTCRFQLVKFTLQERLITQFKISLKTKMASTVFD